MLPIRRYGLVAAAFLFLFASPATAQTAFGIRGGMSVDPDQLFFGVHFDTEPIARHLTFRPNVEAGFGDDLTLVGINLELAYWIPRRNSQWSIYVGGGPAVNIFSVHDGRPGSGDSDFAGGFNLLLGAQRRTGLYAEIKVGLADSPGLKLTVGHTFK